MKQIHCTWTPLVFIVILAACSSKPTETSTGKKSAYEIPENAKLFIRSPGHEDLGGMSEACASFKLSEPQVREMFKHFRKISRAEVQQKYSLAPCYVEGLIETPKQVYSWKFRAGNVIETNYPTGKETLLGGEASKVKTSVR